MKNLYMAGIAGITALTMAACATPEASDSENAEIAQAEVDVRQGEEVRQICFASQIRGWRENDRKSVIVEKGVRDEYKLALNGTCDPREAFLSIGLISRNAANCLSRGDRLVTDSTVAMGGCSIQRIYKWDKDAGEEASES